jgi:hypothetical protein
MAAAQGTHEGCPYGLPRRRMALCFPSPFLMRPTLPRFVIGGWEEEVEGVSCGPLRAGKAFTKRPLTRRRRAATLSPRRGPRLLAARPHFRGTPWRAPTPVTRGVRASFARQGGVPAPRNRRQAVSACPDGRPPVQCAAGNVNPPRRPRRRRGRPRACPQPRRHGRRPGTHEGCPYGLPRRRMVLCFPSSRGPHCAASLSANAKRKMSGTNPSR